MDLYLSSLLLGAAGLSVMALSGLGNRGHGAPTGHLHAGGHGATHGHAHFGHSVAARGGRAGPVAPVAHGMHALPGAASRAMWTITSPRFLFAFFLGLGTSGLLARPFLGGPLLAATAIAGGIFFERVLVSPFWNFLMRFASAPATTLESSVSDEATAVTSFDVNGQGIVSLEVDGQIVQILATLRADDRALGGSRIRAGQLVRVEEVDSEKNRCTISLI
ncbi:MAG: hypothetical protein ABI442_00775 [Gemmatimonadaceae bacterium]